MASIIVDDPEERMKNKPSGIVNSCLNLSLSNSPSFAGSAFKQQKLPAWQPILTAGTVLPTFFLIGIAFIPIGFGLLMSSNQVKQEQFDYTNCLRADKKPCAEVLDKGESDKCLCEMEIELKTDFERDVFIYYGLTNYYQNHRRYVKSRDDKQLLGYKEKPAAECEPFAYRDQPGGKKMPIAPCGAIANSLFNDTFELWRHDSRPTGSVVPIVRSGIAWATDKNAKFRNPEPKNDLPKAFQHYVRPPNWKRDIWNMDPDSKPPLTPDSNGYLYEPLIVWMRTAALPTFRKLYGRVDHSAEAPYHNSLPKGKYNVKIHYSKFFEVLFKVWQ